MTIDWNTCAFADEGCTCGRPSLAMVEQTELDKLRAQVADLADKLHKANADNASLTKAQTAWANEVAAKDAVIEAAKQWGEHYGNTSEAYHNAATALFAALKELPNEQEPCDICSGYGCPDCRDDLAGVAR